MNEFSQTLSNNNRKSLIPSIYTKTILSEIDALLRASSRLRELDKHIVFLSAWRDRTIEHSSNRIEAEAKLNYQEVIKKHIIKWLICKHGIQPGQIESKIKVLRQELDTVV